MNFSRIAGVLKALGDPAILADPDALRLRQEQAAEMALVLERDYQGLARRVADGRNFLVASLCDNDFRILEAVEWALDQLGMNTASTEEEWRPAGWPGSMISKPAGWRVPGSWKFAGASTACLHDRHSRPGPADDHGADGH